MPKKLTQEDVLARLYARHGRRYDYSSVSYVDIRKKIVIICQEHGPFNQGPAEHWKGQGCPPCARPRQTRVPRRSWDEVEPRLTAAHNGKYTYDGSTYRDSNSKIRATCPAHGDFWPQVASHLRGRFGCRRCSYIERGQAKQMSFEQWLQCARERFGDRFEYNPESWNTHTNIGRKQLRFRCPNHGWQAMKPNYHLQSPLGCPTCGRFEGGDKRRLTTEEFVARGTALFHGKYTYDKTAYRAANEKVVVTCQEHGDFWTLPSNHTAGHGCPRCSQGGFDLNAPAIVYYIRIDAPSGVLYKIGITNLTVRERYPCSLDRGRITIVREWPYVVGADAAVHEMGVLRTHGCYRYFGPPILVGVGVTEVFTCDVLGLDGGERPSPPQLSMFDLIRTY
jgi:hypothetical protein